MAAIVALAIFFALIWLLIRAYLVIQTPNDILVDKLGLDIPPPPEITLEEIHGDNVRISWKHQDAYNPLAFYTIHLNGTRVGQTKRTETSVSICCLQPGTYYDIRVFATSSTGFQTPSAILHVRTLNRTRQRGSQGKDDAQIPYIKAYSTRTAAPPSPLSAPPMAREGSGGPAASRRLTGSKRHPSSSPIHSQDQATLHDPEESYDTNSDDESLSQLQSRLEHVKRQIDTSEADIIRDEKEFAATLEELKQEKEATAAKLEERTEASKHLRAQISQHEGRRTSLIKDRAKKEGQLTQKEHEQKNMRDDIARWDDQSRNHQARLNEIKDEKQSMIMDFDRSIQEVYTKINAEEAEAEIIGASNEETKQQLRILSQKSNTNNANLANEANENELRQQEQDLSWQTKINEWAAAQASLSRDIAIARQQFELANNRLGHLKEIRRSEGSGNFVPPVALNLDLARRDPLNRRARQRSSLTSNLSSPAPFLEHEIYGSISTGSPNSIAAQFNLNNGALNFGPEPMRIQDDAEGFIGPVPTSPKEVDLLPKDLLQDNPADDDRMIDNNSDERISSPSSISKRFSGMMPPPTHSEGVVHDAISPVSSSSRPASIFTSPRSSLYHLPESEPRPTGTSDSPNDPSGYADAAQSTSRKLVSNLFSFNRQRGKTMADEPPLLGSLKPGQSQSFPRNLGDSAEDLDYQRKRRSSHASTFFPRASGTGEKNTELPPNRRGMATFFGSSKLHPAVLANLGRSSNQKDSLNPLNLRSESIDASLHNTFRNENSISRASSLRSFDNSQLPRPSTDNSALLLTSLAEKSDRGSSPLRAADWTTPWSRNASRRPSIQHGSSGHLPLDPQLEDAEVIEPSREPFRRLQAPIGTRPKSATQKVAPPKLNPAAAPFKASFFRKAEKDKEKSGSKATTSSTPNDSQASVCGDASPSSARKSRENQSINTPESFVESPDVLERTASGTPSEGVPSKETLIQKLTRKGSSTKFNSWKGKDKGSKFSKKGDGNTTNDVDEDTGSEGQLGRSVDSSNSMPLEKDKSARSSLSFSSFMKTTRKPDKRKTQDVSESSEVGESETGDESLADEAG